MMDALVQDVRYALRIFGGSRGFTAMAITMLALGIGANAAIFSVVNALLWRPLPAADPETLAALLRGDEQAWSYGGYVDFRDGTRMFSGLAAHTAEALTLHIDGHGEIVFGHVVTGNFFDVIGIAASRGRMLLADDDTASAQAAAVLSFNFWKRRFGTTPDAVGRSMILNGYRFTIVGIAPEGFIGAIPPFSADVWVPYAMWARLRHLQATGPTHLARRRGRRARG